MAQIRRGVPSGQSRTRRCCIIQIRLSREGRWRLRQSLPAGSLMAKGADRSPRKPLKESNVRHAQVPVPSPRLLPSPIKPGSLGSLAVESRDSRQCTCSKGNRSRLSSARRGRFSPLAAYLDGAVEDAGLSINTQRLPRPPPTNCSLGHLCQLVRPDLALSEPGQHRH